MGALSAILVILSLNKLGPLVADYKIGYVNPAYTSLDHIKNKFGRIKNKKLIADWPDCLEGKREKGEGEASCCVHGSYCSFSCSFHLLSATKELTSIFTETAP